MTLEAADWTDILTILSETYKIWSPGLTRSSYQEFIWQQMHHPWSRGNFRYLVLKVGKEAAASCKLYQLVFAYRGQLKQVTALGAVYTLSHMRRRGWARRLVGEVINLARTENQDAIVLFSDIGHDFYLPFGFEPTGCRQFRIDLDRVTYDRCHEAIVRDIKSFQESDTDEIGRHYLRWLRRQPWGIHRSHLYWSFRLWRERYLKKHSRWQWPDLELVRTGFKDRAYALIECAGATLRVMEAVADAASVAALWQTILQTAKDRQIRRLSGWEGTMPEAIASPRLYQRQWAQPMLLPLTKEASRWINIMPCPLLELDTV